MLEDIDFKLETKKSFYFSKGLFIKNVIQKCNSSQFFAEGRKAVVEAKVVTRLRSRRRKP